MTTRLDRMASRFWHRLAVACNWAGFLTSKVSSFCIYREVHILAEAGALPDREGVDVPEPGRAGVCAGRKCPKARHCPHYYTEYPAACCECAERFG